MGSASVRSGAHSLSSRQRPSLPQYLDVGTKKPTVQPAASFLLLRATGSLGWTKTNLSHVAEWPLCVPCEVQSSPPPPPPGCRCCRESSKEQIGKSGPGCNNTDARSRGRSHLGGRVFRKFRRVEVPWKHRTWVLETSSDLRVLCSEC